MKKNEIPLESEKNIRSEKEKIKNSGDNMPENKPSKHSRESHESSSRFIVRNNIRATLGVIILVLLGILVYYNFPKEITDDNQKEKIIAKMFEAENKFKSSDNFKEVAKDLNGSVYSTLERKGDMFKYEDKHRKVWGNISSKEAYSQNIPTDFIEDFSNIINLFDSFSVNPYYEFERYISSGPYKTKIKRQGGTYIIELELNGKKTGLYIGASDYLPREYVIYSDIYAKEDDIKGLKFTYSKGNAKEENVNIPEEIRSNVVKP